MKFESKQISISDEEFGCEITLSENAEQSEFENGQSVEEIINSLGRYIVIQRTYPEDEFEKDYIYFESSDFEKSGELKDFEIILSRTKFVLTFEKEEYEITIDLDNLKFDEFKTVLQKIVATKGNMILKN